MIRILLCVCLLFVGFTFNICGPALAAQGDGALDTIPQITHLAFTLLGMGAAAGLAYQAFGRAVPIADVPTFPRYMTSRQQYRLGGWIFVAFACVFFLLLVREHGQVLVLAESFKVIPDSILAAAKDQSAPYVVIIVAMGMVYLYLLKLEAPWNVLLMVRDVIQNSISVPQLAKQIVTQIQFSLDVPQHAISQIVAAAGGAVLDQDFHKDRNTPDRKWAETYYMKEWLTRALSAGEDATFFTEDSFAFATLVSEFEGTSSSMSKWRHGVAMEGGRSDLTQTVVDLHRRFSRLVACYLIYRNGSRNALSVEAEKFGIEISRQPNQNPLRYWIVYVMALMASVYVGVYASAVYYDLADGKGLVLAQSPDRALTWALYSISNYGLAIIVILFLRFLVTSSNQSHLVTYCWTFFVALFVGPLGLTMAVHFFAPDPIGSSPLIPLYYAMLQWGLGPALVCVYISYYLDRQVCDDLPDIVHSSRTVAWRLLNCFGFAGITVVLLLPALLAIKEQSDHTWELAKLRFVATGVTFCVALGLALAAQFALRKDRQSTDVALQVRTDP